MEITIQPGDVLEGRYRFEHPIGFGAYGHVWKAWHEKLNKPLAIKVIDIGHLDSTSLLRIKQECRVGGELGSDAGVVQVYDAFEQNGQLFIVMELMEGGSLEKVLREEPPDFAVALSWALDLCRALGQVHARGIVHRDIKPQNILLTSEGRPKFSDFGVAHLPQSAITTYQPGTPGYRAQELEKGYPATPAADVYSLSAVLFEMWSGRPYAPLKALPPETVRQEFLACLAHEYPSVPETAREILAQAVLGGLAPDPTKRSGLEELCSRLEEIRQALGASTNVVEQVREVMVRRTRLQPSPTTLVSRLIQIPQPLPSAPRGQTALVEWLADEFGEWFLQRPEHEIILWFDPVREWEPVLELLRPHLNLICDEGSLLEVRYQLEKRRPGEQVVVYIPRPRKEADYLKPFTFIGRVFEQTLYDFLLNHNVPLPKYGKDRQMLQNLLPRLVPASVGKGETFWQRLRTLEDAENLLLPNFQERLFQFLAHPDPAWKDLEQEGLAPVFVNLITRRYGHHISERPPAEMARRLLAHWVLVDVYVRAGQPDDYPFAGALPDPFYFAACRGALDAFRHDSRYHETFTSLIRDVEAEYQGLGVWAARQAGLQAELPLPGLAREAWLQMVKRIQQWHRWDEVVTDLQAMRPEIQQAAAGYWSRTGEVPGWEVLKQAVEVILPAEAAIQKAATLTRPDEFVQAYVNHWWQVDQAYRRYRVSVNASTDYRALSRWVIRFYERFLEQVNVRWTELLMRSTAWPPDTPVLAAREASHSIWNEQGRQAVFVVDALRYELAAELREQFSGGTVSLVPWMTELPSITPLGMSALLPETSNRQITWEQEWRISVPGFERNLADKSARKAWLQSQMPNMALLPLHKWLLPETQVPVTARTLVIFADELDALGEHAGELSVITFSDLLQKIAQGVRKALEVGFEVVHIVTDHGFLLLGHVTESGKIDPNGDVALKAAHRYLLGRNLPQREGLLRFPIAGSEDLVCWFPPGLACFKVGGRYNYIHGGPALQEVIIPYLRVQQDVARMPVGVRLVVDDRIYSGVFKVVLEPVRPGLFVREREVRLILQGPDGRIIRSSEEIVGPEEPVAKNLKLLPEDGVRFGETILLAVQDAHTDEELDRKEIEVHVDLEL